MGSDTRFDYSAIGDAVNLAARLESSTKEVGEDIVIGYTTAINSTIKTRYLDPIKVKGKKDEIIIYTIDLNPLRQTEKLCIKKLLHLKQVVLDTIRYVNTEHTVSQFSLFSHFSSI